MDGDGIPDTVIPDSYDYINIIPDAILPPVRQEALNRSRPQPDADVYDFPAEWYPSPDTELVSPDTSALDIEPSNRRHRRAYMRSRNEEPRTTFYGSGDVVVPRDELILPTRASTSAANSARRDTTGRQLSNTGRQPSNTGRQPSNTGRQPSNTGRQPTTSTCKPRSNITCKKTQKTTSSSASASSSSASSASAAALHAKKLEKLSKEDKKKVEKKYKKKLLSGWVEMAQQQSRSFFSWIVSRFYSRTKPV